MVFLPQITQTFLALLLQSPMRLETFLNLVIRTLTKKTSVMQLSLLHNGLLLYLGNFNLNPKYRSQLSLLITTRMILIFLSEIQFRLFRVKCPSNSPKKGNCHVNNRKLFQTRKIKLTLRKTITTWMIY